MKFHVTFTTDDILHLEHTGNTSATLGHQLMHPTYNTPAPSLYAMPGQLRAAGEHLISLAEQVGE